MPAASRYSPEQIVEARRLYAEGSKLADIVAQTGIPASTLYYHLGRDPAKTGHVLPPIPLRRDEATKIRRATNRTSRPALIARLWTTAERQVAEIETRLIEAGGDAASLERDAKTLSVLARTVRDLVALDEATARKTESANAEDEIPRDPDALRRALAEKLVELGRLEQDD